MVIASKIQFKWFDRKNYLAELQRRLLKLLIDSGCYFVRNGKGDHQIWWSPVSQRNFTVDAGITSRNMANVVLKQAGLPKHF
jgi:HicA toxin of bacterial toxin-antitoxin,